MRSITISVPLKATLLGEHAVVYGHRAIAIAIPLRIKFTMIPTSCNCTEVVCHGLSAEVFMARIRGDVIDVVANREDVKRALSYVVTALRLCEKMLDVRLLNARIEIQSSVPMGVGLGTSAAVSVGVVALCYAVLGEDVMSNRNRIRIAEIGWKVEREVQGAASPMDTFTVALGGVRLVDPKASTVEGIATKLNVIDMPILVGYTPKKTSTKELIMYVRSILDRTSIGKAILSVIGDLVDEAVEAINRNDLELLGMLMNINHGLLNALGVVDKDTETIVRVLRKGGALGAKMSGAGGGGAFVALARSRSDIDKLVYLCRAFEVSIASTSIDENGIIAE